jgi:hypothetical protein
MTHEHTPKKVFLALHMFNVHHILPKKKSFLNYKFFGTIMNYFFGDQRKSLKP